MYIDKDLKRKKQKIDYNSINQIQEKKLFKS